jgi:RNA polymerase sigma-70 factor (ECF subfamily)
MKRNARPMRAAVLRSIGPSPAMSYPASDRKKIIFLVVPIETSAYDGKNFFVLFCVTSEPLRELILNNYREWVIDRERLRQDMAYRREVVGELVAQFHGDIYRYCYLFFGETEARDIVQEVFQVVWTDLHKFKKDSKIKSWITGIAKNKCRRLLRDRSRRRALIEQFRDEIGRRLHHNTDESEAIDRLSKCLAELDTSDRFLLHGHFVEGKPYKDIAEVAGKSATTIQRHIVQIIKKLRKCMHADVD